MKWWVGYVLIALAFVCAIIAVVAGVLAFSALDDAEAARERANFLADKVERLEERATQNRAIAIASCERGNIIRRQQDQMAFVQKATNEEFADFLASSAAFRRASGQDALAAQSSRSRKRVLDFAKAVIPLGSLNCEAVIP